MIKVTTIIETVDTYPKPATKNPTRLEFVSDSPVSDNPRFYADAVQRAVWKAAAEVHEFMEKSVDLKVGP